MFSSVYNKREQGIIKVWIWLDYVIFLNYIGISIFWELKEFNFTLACHRTVFGEEFTSLINVRFIIKFTKLIIKKLNALFIKSWCKKIPKKSITQLIYHLNRVWII